MIKKSDQPKIGLPPRNNTQRYLRFSTIGLEMGLGVGVGWLIGQWLDGMFGTGPWLLLLFLCFGMGAGFLSLWRALKAMEAEQEEDERRQSEAEQDENGPG